jgi:hypothetical protein
MPAGVRLDFQTSARNRGIGGRDIERECQRFAHDSGERPDTDPDGADADVAQARQLVIHRFHEAERERQLMHGVTGNRSRRVRFQTVERPSAASRVDVL